MVSFEEFPISTSNYVPGYKVVEVKGFVYGLTVRARGLGGDIGAGLKGLVGGELPKYNEMMNNARALATKRMVEEAQSLGADAVVCVRYASASIMQSAAEIMAYGTAVKFK